MTSKRIVLSVVSFLALLGTGIAGEEVLPATSTLAPAPASQPPVAGALSPVTSACPQGETTLAQALGLREAGGIPCNDLNCPPPLYYCCGPDWRTGCCAW